MTKGKKGAKKPASKKKERATQKPEDKKDEGSKWQDFLHRHSKVKEDKK